MTRRIKLALILAAPFAGWGLAWAYVTVGPAWFWTAASAAVLLALGTWLYGRLTREPGGTHAADPLTEPVPAPAPEVSYGPFLAAPPVAFTHDEYAPDQDYDGHARRHGGVLTPVLAPAAFAVAILRAHIAALMETRRLEDEARFPWLASGQYGDWATGSFARIDAELAKAGEVA